MLPQCKLIKQEPKQRRILGVDFKRVYLLPWGGAAVFMNENVCRTATEWESACRRVRDRGSLNSQSLQEAILAGFGAMSLFLNNNTSKLS